MALGDAAVIVDRDANSRTKREFYIKGALLRWDLQLSLFVWVDCL